MSGALIPNAPELLTPEQRERRAANEKRQKRERALVRGVIRALKAAGWQPHSVDDGGEEREKTPTESAMMEAVFAVDQATAYFQHEARVNRCCIVFVCGEGDDIIADHSAPANDPKAFAATIDAFMRGAGLYC